MTQHTRRAFFGSAAVLGAGAVITSVPVISGAGQAAARPDPIADELQRQLKAAIVLMQERKGEGARRAAAIFRLAAVNNAAHGTDAILQKALRDQVKKEGKSAIMLRRPSHAQHLKMQSEAREFGVTNLTIPADVATRERAFDALLKGGLTGQYLRAAAFFDAAGRQLDARAALAPVALRRNDQEDCNKAREYRDDIAATAASICGAAQLMPWIPGLPQACALALGALGGAEMSILLMCSWWGL
jgi:hypothetical protein